MLQFWFGRRLALPLVVAALVALAAGGFLMSSGVAATAQDVSVAIDNFAFGPGTITVKRGTRVIWTNKDDDVHTVVADGDPKLWKSPPLDTDDSSPSSSTRPAPTNTSARSIRACRAPSSSNDRFIARRLATRPMAEPAPSR